MTTTAENTETLTTQSRDGTPIAVWKSGRGPSLLAVHCGCAAPARRTRVRCRHGSDGPDERGAACYTASPRGYRWPRSRGASRSR